MTLGLAGVLADARALWRSERELLLSIAGMFFVVPNWLASSALSFGAGVAVQHNRMGTSVNASISRVRVLPSNALRIELSSSTTAPNCDGSKCGSIS